eukprot:1160200-Pelagomonas_calceolata.AAC.1
MEVLQRKLTYTKLPGQETHGHYAAGMPASFIQALKGLKMTASYLNDEGRRQRAPITARHKKGLEPLLVCSTELAFVNYASSTTPFSFILGTCDSTLIRGWLTKEKPQSKSKLGTHHWRVLRVI